MLLDRKVKSLGIIGFFEKRHIRSFFGLLVDGLSSQGMFGKLVPFTMILLTYFSYYYSFASSIKAFHCGDTVSIS